LYSYIDAVALSPKFDEILSKLSDVEIPVEALSLGKELGEGIYARALNTFNTVQHVC